MRYSEDRIAAVEIEGRKYRSKTLLDQAIAQSDERQAAGRIWKARPQLRKVSNHIAIISFVVFGIGFEALLDNLGTAGLLRSMPLWLSIPLMIMGGYGCDLSGRLDGMLEFDRHPILSPRERVAVERAAVQAERKTASYRAKIDAEWDAITGQPGIQPHEAFTQYEEFLKNEEAKRKRQAFWGMDWISFTGLVAFVGLFTYLIGYGLWSYGGDFWSLIWFGIHAAALVALLVYGFVKLLIIKPQADALLTPGPVPRKRSEATRWDAARRAANLNHFWRMGGGAGERVPFEAVSPLPRDGPDAEESVSSPETRMALPGPKKK